jgi:hypothetical protein
MNGLGRFRAWVTQSWLRFFLAIGILSGGLWGIAMLVMWNLVVSLQPQWGFPKATIASLVAPSTGFGLTWTGTMWLFVLWERRRMARRTKSN